MESLKERRFFEQIVLIMAQDSGQVHKICWFWCKTERSKISQEFWSKVLMLKECRTNILNFRPDFRFSSSWFPWQVLTRVRFLTNFCFVATDLQSLLFEKYFLSSELHNIICGCRKDYICTKGSLFCAKIIIKCRFVPVFSLNISSAISLIFPSSVWC